jgi:hypothetical protein
LALYGGWMHMSMELAGVPVSGGGRRMSRPS